MATSDTELAEEIVSFGSYEPEQLTPSGAQTSIQRAKRHLKLEAQIDKPDPNWYTNEYLHEALFWTSMLFSKLQTGALDSKMIAVGAIEEDSLLANEDGQVTEWYRQYKRERNRLRARRSNPDYQRRSQRTTVDGDRYYEVDEV